mmetsp:Transcript_3001/g.7675  ORF Transcript_3001/g.7675 Transcript_3001/m.7675 type:complete len:325 (+) Transcript_3001:147-1121(+)
MNKARAMLDALMGPDRDSMDKSNKKTEKFKDASVCKAFLVGRCPFDGTMLGGKRKFPVCDLLHSETMKAQLEAHPEAESLKLEYEAGSMKDLEFAVRECDTHIANEKARMAKEVWLKKPPLPAAVNDKLAAMKRESSTMIQRAETLDDDQLREKDELIRKANELIKDREAFLEVETKKAEAATPAEQVCEICGTVFAGKDGDAAHLMFRIHEAYSKVREWVKEVQPKAAEFNKQQQEKKDEDLRKKRKEEWEKVQEKDGGGKDRDRDRDRERDRRKSRDGDDRNGRDGRSRSKHHHRPRSGDPGRNRRGRSRDSREPTRERRRR